MLLFLGFCFLFSAALVGVKDEKTWAKQRKRFEGHGIASFSIPLHLWRSTSTYRKKDSDEGGRRRVEREKERGGGRDSLRRLTEAELFTVPCQPPTILKIMYFYIHLKGLTQGACLKRDRGICLNVHFDNNRLTCT